MSRLVLIAPAVCAALGATACTDLDEFRTDPGEVFRGTVIGTESDGDCAAGGTCSFIRRGFPAGTGLELTFDPDAVTTTPGTLTTDDAQCGTPTFLGAELLPIEALVHDQLSLYDFPGGGRVRNYIFLTRSVTGPLSGREATVYVSLIRDGRVEVRIIAGTGRECQPSDCADFMAGRCDFFGVFPLKRGQSP